MGWYVYVCAGVHVKILNAAVGKRLNLTNIQVYVPYLYINISMADNFQQRSLKHSTEKRKPLQ